MSDSPRREHLKTMASGKNVPATIPALGGEASLNRYLSEIRKFPLLTPEEEAPAKPKSGSARKNYLMGFGRGYLLRKWGVLTSRAMSPMAASTTSW